MRLPWSMLFRHIETIKLRNDGTTNMRKIPNAIFTCVAYVKNPCRLFTLRIPMRCAKRVTFNYWSTLDGVKYAMQNNCALHISDFFIAKKPQSQMQVFRRLFTVQCKTCDVRISRDERNHPTS